MYDMILHYIYIIYIYQYCVTVLIYTYHYKSHVLWITISLYYYIPLYITVLMSYMTWTYRVTSLAPRGAGLSSFAPSMRKTTASVAAMVDVGGPAGHLGRSNGWRNLGKPWELRKNYGKKTLRNWEKKGEILEMLKNFRHISDFLWGEMEISSGFDHMKWRLKWVWIKKWWFHWIQPL